MNWIPSVKPLLIGVMTTLALYTHAQKPKSYPAVTQELAAKIVAAPAPKTPHSLAVVPFTATPSSQQSKAFGEYLTETIIGLISGHPDQLKLFERTRMDAILKEHEFILTDLMKPAAALKIGQLAPIDAILSGTYTKLKSYIEVSARIIDVTSGEITLSYVGRIKMNKNMASLFTHPDEAQPLAHEKDSREQISFNGNTPVPAKTAAEVCKEKAEAFRSHLNDLSTPEKISVVVNEAVKTPFDNECGKLHYDVMYAFTRFKLNPEPYKNFLLATLDTIAYPAGDDRAYEIVRYLANDKQVDAREWRSGFAAMSKVGNYYLSNYVTQLIGNTDAAPDEQQHRVQQFFDLAAQNKLGLPRPLTFEVAYVEMMEGLSKNQSLRQHVYSVYAGRLTRDEKLNATLFGELSSMYKEETHPQRKTELINWVAAFVNANEYPKAPEQLYDFVWHFRMTYNEATNEEIRRNYPESDLKILTDRCRARFSAYALLTPYPSQQEDRVNFCVKYNIAIPGVIPTVDEAEVILKGNNLAEQLRVMKLVALAETPPVTLENTLVSLLNKKSLEDKTTMNTIQTLAITVLGNLKTSNPKAIEFMLATLPHYGNDTEAAMEALVKIGRPAIKAVTTRLDKTTDQDGGLQHQLITILGRMGKEAVGSQKSIQRILAITRNNDVRYAAEAALQAIGD